MCGIAGVFGFSDRALVRRMADSIRHRGIDDEGYYNGPDVSLGVRRLAVIDIHGGKQPMTNEEGDLVIVHNGEVYNHAELRPELEALGHRYRTHSDTETILHAYEAWGEGCVQHFVGMFAFAIYHVKRRELFLARDRLGVKPLYYALAGDAFLFASEPKGILEFEELRAEPDPTAVYNFLKFRYNAGEQSMFRGIRKLPPGHTMRVDRMKNRTARRYWSLRVEEHAADAETMARRLRELLESSVRYRLVSDVPVGVYLSGGVDSGSVAALMAKAGETVKTFSVGFGGHYEDDPYFADELGFAKKMAEHIGSDHREIILEKDAINLLEKVIWHLDEPMSDLATIPVYALSREAKREVTVILTGDGNDEVWAGYDKYRMLLAWNRRRGLVPAPVRRVVPKLAKVVPGETLKAKVASGGQLMDAGESFLWYGNVFADREDEALFQTTFLKQVGSPRPRDIAVTPFFGGTSQPLNQMLLSDVSVLLPDSYLVKADRMTMAWSVENREPLIDHRIVEFAFTVPAAMKLHDDEEKWLYRIAVRDLLPPDIVSRKKKGFNVPVHHWLKHNPDLRALLDEEQIRKRGYFRWDFVRKLVSKAKDPTPADAQRLWSLLTLEMWLQQLDRRAA